MNLQIWRVAVAVGLVLPAALVVPAHAAVVAVAPYDFNGDGYPELVVGAPDLQVGSVKAAGGVVVLPASKKGLSLDEQVITQSSPGVPGASETGDRFGSAVASADLNGDGFADLAVGHPGESVGAARGAGSVTVVYGSRSGLDTRTSVGIDVRGSVGLGTALVAADLTGDGIADLAVGAPDEDLATDSPLGFQPSGVVHIFAGAEGGVTTAAQVSVRRQSEGDTGDVNFGQLLTAADLDGDGVADLVVGSGGVEEDEYGAPGSVSVCLGAEGGPAGCTRVLQSREIGGQRALAVGNVTGTSEPEIVVGAHDTIDGPGHVTVVHLRDDSTTPAKAPTVLTEKGLGFPDSLDDGFGTGVALGDVDRDGYADIVVGAGYKDDYRGGVFVVRGRADGAFTKARSASFDQSTAGVPGKREKNDQFGSSVTLLDHNADGRLDLSIGAPGENGDDGAVTILRGSGKSFTTSGSTTFGLATLRYPHPSDASFGSSLGAPTSS